MLHTEDTHLENTFLVDILGGFSLGGVFARAAGIVTGVAVGVSIVVEIILRHERRLLPVVLRVLRRGLRLLVGRLKVMTGEQVLRLRIRVSTER